MAEDFIQDIYKRAILFSKYQKCIKDLHRYDDVSFSRDWSDTTETACLVLEEIKKYDVKEAEAFADCLYRIPKENKNYAIARELIENGIIPVLYKYIHDYANIEVSEGKWTLCSSRSGFLNLFDRDKNTYIHSLNDPLEEALEQAAAKYDPKYDSIHILGGGLGYLPYALWEKSYKSAHIYIYEFEKEIVEYARAYGMLEYINDGDYEIVYCDDKNELLNRFINVNGDDCALKIISPWMIDNYDGHIRDELVLYNSNENVAEMFKTIQSINYMRNSNCSYSGVSSLKKMIKGEEFIVVAAGPSLDENIDYLKKSSGKIIIAVNTVLKRLLREGVKPDILCLVDPTDGVYKHISGVEEQTWDIPLVYESVAYWKFIKEHKGEKYRVLSADTDYTVNEAARHPEDVIRVSGTVTSLALELSFYLGAKTVEIIGADLSFPGDKLYAGEESKRIDRKYANNYLEICSNDGRKVTTVDTFYSFKDGLEKSILGNQKVEVINLSEQGAYIKGTISGPWKQVAKKEAISEKYLLDDRSLELLSYAGKILSGTYAGYEGNLCDCLDKIEHECINIQGVTDVLKVWMNITNEQGDVRGEVFLASLLFELTPGAGLIDKMVEQIKDSGFSKEEKFFYYSQLSNMKQRCDALTGAEDDLIRLKESIIKDYYTAFGDDYIRKVPNSLRDKGLVYVMTDDIERPFSDTTVKTLEECINLKGKGNEVILICSMEKCTQVASKELYNSIKADSGKTVTDNVICYKNCEIPFVKCENIMPNDEMIRLILDNIKERKPGRVICLGEGPLEWLSKVVID